MLWKSFRFSFDELELKINYLLGKYMLVCRTTDFLYRDKGSEVAKFFFKSMDCLYAFDFQGDYRIGEAFLVGCWLSSALWDECTKMRKALINKLDIIIHLDYLKGMEMHWNV